MSARTIWTGILAALVGLINSAALAATLSGDTFKTIQSGEIDWRRFLPLFIFITILQFLVAWFITRKSDQIKLREGSRRFAKFFSNWYGAHGNIGSVALPDRMIKAGLSCDLSD